MSWWLWKSMHVSRESKAIKDGSCNNDRCWRPKKLMKLRCDGENRRALEALRCFSPLSAAPCLWGRIQCRKGWDKNLQTETAKERNVRLRRKECFKKKASKSHGQFKYDVMKSNSQEPFWWWDFSHRHSGVYSFLRKNNRKNELLLCLLKHLLKM